MIRQGQCCGIFTHVTVMREKNYFYSLHITPRSPAQSFSNCILVCKREFSNNYSMRYFVFPFAFSCLWRDAAVWVLHWLRPKGMNRIQKLQKCFVHKARRISSNLEDQQIFWTSGRKRYCFISYICSVKKLKTSVPRRSEVLCKSNKST